MHVDSHCHKTLITKANRLVKFAPGQKNSNNWDDGYTFNLFLTDGSDIRMTDYTKAFEDYWKRSGYSSSRNELTKRTAFNAWKASRRAIVHLNRSAIISARK